MKARYKVAWLAACTLAISIAAGKSQGEGTDVVASAAEGVWFGPPERTSLSRAHAAYLSGNFGTVAKEIKNVLQTGDEEEKSNALALLEASYRSLKGGQLPVDWHLPDVVLDMKLGVWRAEADDGRIAYRLRIKSRVVREDAVRQMQIVKYPEEVILDRQAGIGEWENESDADGFKFRFQTPKLRQPPAEGLYLLTMELDDGKRVDGWVVLSNLVSSASPAIIEPTSGSTVLTGNPIVRWTDFKSPEFQDGEKRSLYVAVFKGESGQAAWPVVWGLFETPTTSTSVVVGTSPGGTGVADLADGSYAIAVSYFESRWFGDIRLLRESASTKNFVVKR